MRRTPLKSRYVNTGPDVATVQLVLGRAGWACEICDTGFFGERGRQWHLHHRRPRGLGGTRWDGANLPSNLLALCRFCHDDIESRREHALEYGRLVPQGVDPATVPVMVVPGLRYLDDDGAYRWVE